MNKLTIGLSLAALAACGAALAGQATQSAHGWREPGPVTRAEAQQHAAQMFERMDANRDGKIDPSDREARRTARRTEMFERIDANHDGQVSREEFVNLRMDRPMHGGHDGMGPEGMEGHGMHGGGMGGHEMGGPGMGHHGMGHRGMGMHGMGAMMLGKADTNKDGAVGKDEFTTAFMQHFDQVDANHDGTVTPEERRAAHEAMRRQHMQDRMGGPGTAAPPPAAN